MLCIGLMTLCRACSLILAIESSCDDSAIAIIDTKNGKIVFNEAISQECEHAKYGGVVPELAARLHAAALPELLRKAKPYFPQLKAVAVTNEPGLVVSLLEGVMLAKGLALALNIPLLGIHHLKGHLYSIFIEKEPFFPFSSLIVSGGHSQIVEVKSFYDMHVVGATLDDSVGESFDKVAKMMGHAYPGGPIIEKLAKEGDENRFDFPLPLKQHKEIAFSYSGLKNSVRLEIEKLGPRTNQDECDIAASFQKAAFYHLLHQLKRYFKHTKVKDFSLVGGVSANLYFRAQLEVLCNSFNIKLHVADLAYCSDNAAMIARASLEAYHQNLTTTVAQCDVMSRLSL